MAHISLQMYTLRDFVKTPEAVRETYRKVADIGYRYVQPIRPGFMEPEAFAALLRSCGLKADSFSYGGLDVSEKIDALRREAEALDTPFVRGASVSKEQSYTPEGFRAAARRLNDQAECLRRHGLRYLYHFHAYEFVDFGDFTGMDILLKEAPALEFQPDVHWLAAAGYEPSQALNMFAGRAPYLHMQGYAIHPDPEQKRNICDATVPVGQGALNWTGIVETGRRMGVEIYVAEQDYCYIEPFASVAQCFNALRELGVAP